VQSINRIYICAALIAMVLFASGRTFGQAPVGAPADSQFKFSTPIAPGVAVPDKIESSIGTLNLSYGPSRMRLCRNCRRSPVFISSSRAVVRPAEVLPTMLASTSVK